MKSFCLFVCLIATVWGNYHRKCLGWQGADNTIKHHNDVMCVCVCVCGRLFISCSVALQWTRVPFDPWLLARVLWSHLCRHFQAQKWAIFKRRVHFRVKIWQQVGLHACSFNWRAKIKYKRVFEPFRPLNVSGARCRRRSCLRPKIPFSIQVFNGPTTTTTIDNVAWRRRESKKNQRKLERCAQRQLPNYSRPVLNPLPLFFVPMQIHTFFVCIQNSNCCFSERAEFKWRGHDERDTMSVNDPRKWPLSIIHLV